MESKREGKEKGGKAEDKCGGGKRKKGKGKGKGKSPLQLFPIAVVIW